MPRGSTWRERARTLKRDAHAIYLASRDPRAPWYAKALAACVLGYLLSPIDLIPDFIPVIGYLDDLVIVPAGVVLVIKLIPPEVMAEHREAARLASFELRPNWIAVAVIIGFWVSLVGAVIGLLWRHF